MERKLKVDENTGFKGWDDGVVRPDEKWENVILKDSLRSYQISNYRRIRNPKTNYIQTVYQNPDGTEYFIYETFYKDRDGRYLSKVTMVDTMMEKAFSD